MKSDLQMAEPRSAVILRHTRKAIRDRQLVVTTFAAQVAERYLASHEMHLRVVTFREPVGDIDAMADTMKHNAQIVDRLVKGVVKAFPVDLEEAWTDALPEPHRMDCKRQLARRMGFLGALARDPRDCAHATMGDVLHEFGEFVGVSGIALSQQTLDSVSQQQFLRELDDVVAALTSLRAQVLDRAAGAAVELPPGVRHG